MDSATDNTYIETKQIIRGEARMKADFVPLSAWIDETYGVKTVNISYDVIEQGRPHIHVYVEYEHDWNKLLKLHYSSLDTIERQFRETIGRQGLAQSNNLRARLFGQDKNVRYLTDYVHITFGAFETDVRKETRSNISQSQLDEFIKSLSNNDIWTIEFGYNTPPTFFVFTDRQVQHYDQPAIKSMWTDQFYGFIKPFDEFNYFGRDRRQIAIDSKENFDNNFCSNWYYYYK